MGFDQNDFAELHAMGGSQATPLVDLETAQLGSEDEDIDMLGESAEAQLNESYDFTLATNVEELKQIRRTIFARPPIVSDAMQMAPGGSGDVTEDQGPPSTVVIMEEQMEEGQISAVVADFRCRVGNWSIPMMPLQRVDTTRI